MLTFQKVTPPEKAVTALQDALLSSINRGDRTLWLISGGSNIPLSVQVMEKIPDDLSKNLVIMLTDERYGDVGHPDSNIFQLQQAGFDAKQALLIPTLIGRELDVTERHYSGAFDQASQEAKVIIAQFGIGPDGHIAGVKPHSPAVSSDQLSAGYDWDDFTRITLTPLALSRVNQAYAYAYGEAKRDTLERLKTENLTIDEQPAQILKKIPKAEVYNDQIEGENI